jgi:hypothetical protein
MTTSEHVYADYDKTPYGTLYPGELIFVAQKRGQELLNP